MPWIGFNLNGAKYFFCISLAQLERVVLQRYEPIDPKSFNWSIGEPELSGPDSPARWRCTLDLLEADGGDFFDATGVDQTRMVGDFFEESFAFWRTTGGTPRGSAKG
jgi:hypothetical protein